ncbi:MAG: response regulator [Leptospirillia bacterium]
MTALRNNHMERIPISVLVVDDNTDILGMFQTLLGQRGESVTLKSSGQEAIDLLAERTFDLVVTDLKMGEVNGLDVLKAVRDVSPRTIVVMMTGYASLETAIEAIRGGAYDYITKPFTLQEIDVLLDNLSERIRMQQENDLLIRELGDAYRLIAELQDIAADGATRGTPPPVGAAASPPDRRTPRRARSDVQDVPFPKGVAAYQDVKWASVRSRDRLRTLFDLGHLSRMDYDKLCRLIPKEFPTA